MSLKGTRRSWAKAAGAALSSQQLGIAFFFNQSDGSGKLPGDEQLSHQTPAALAEVWCHKASLGSLGCRQQGASTTSTFLERSGGQGHPWHGEWVREVTWWCRLCQCSAMGGTHCPVPPGRAEGCWEWEKSPLTPHTIGPWGVQHGERQVLWSWGWRMLLLPAPRGS